MPRCCGIDALVDVGSWYEIYVGPTNGLPVTVLIGFCLISWTESFPLTAYQVLLNDDLHLPLSTISTYYAVTYLPWMWKPLFGWISDHCPLFGKHRTPYITLSALGLAILQVVLGTCVHSEETLFVVAFCSSICSSFLQLMVGSFLVDFARRDVENSAALQSMANASQWVGTLIAQLMALAVYATKARSRGVARAAITGSAMAPLLLALIAPLLPEQVDVAVATPRLEQSDRRDRRCKLPGWRAMRYSFVVAIVQINLIVVGCKSLMSPASWWRVVWLTVSFSGVLLGLGATASFWARVRLRPRDDRDSLARSNDGHSRGDDALSERSELRQSWHWIRLCLFCFLVNAVPNSSVAVGQFQYAALAPESYQILSVISPVSNLCAALAFGRGCNRRGARTMFTAATILAAIVSLAPLPFVYAASGAAAGITPRHEFWSAVGAWSLGATILGGATTMLTVLPVDTLVTASSGSLAVNRSSSSYAMLLSFYSFGATTSGLISAPALEALGIGGTHWNALPRWIVFSALMRLALLSLVCLIPVVTGSGANIDRVASDPVAISIARSAV
eukprot:TRINITY_DN12787_c1_g1_i1.p1 TRINITY_DN12787_c1_g1~~TRINITY_DN12787_c1_g1_i1.p1  ORF type:complete len:563 (+),score=49.63 TRINITY_DN12787_c1_g1_i1:123-1811(+)